VHGDAADEDRAIPSPFTILVLAFAWVRRAPAADSYLPLVACREDVASTLFFPAMAAVEGIGTAFGFHAPWLYAGKASHRDIEGVEDLMAALEGRGK